MNQRNVIIIKGVSGSGKSSFAELIAEPKVVCCADFYFEKNGKYKFDATKLGQAHASCRKAFDEALHNFRVDNIVVANTNVKESDYAYYVAEANKVGARTTYVVLEKRHNNTSVHNVGEEVLERQHTNLVNNLKLK